MRPARRGLRRHRHLALFALAALAALSCIDGEPPAPDRAARDMALLVQGALPSVPGAPPLASAAVRVFAVDGLASGRVILEQELPLNGGFRLEPPLPLRVNATDSRATRAWVEVELRGLPPEKRTEWSARSDTFALSAGGSRNLSLAFGRGPFAWLGTTTVRIEEVRPLRLVPGLSTVLRVVADPGVTPYLYVLDAGVARLGPGYGLVMGAGSGTTAIVAMAGLRADTLPVEVERVPASITISPTQVEVTSLHDTVTFAIEARDSARTLLRMPQLSFASSDARVAGFVDSLHAESEGDGETVLTVSAFHDPAVRASARWVTRQRAVRMGLSPASTTFRGLQVQRILTATPVDARGYRLLKPAVQWRVAGPATLEALPGSVGDTRLLVPSGEAGTVTVSAAVDELEASSTFQLLPAIRWLEVSGAATLPAVGSTTRFTAMAVDELGQRLPVPVRWSSSDAVVASVDAAGMVTGLADGTATITARSDSFNVASGREVTVLAPAVRLELSDAGMWGTPPVLDAWILLPVRALTARGNPARGAQVSWSASGGNLYTKSSTTDINGFATAWWGFAPAGSYTVTATLDGSSASATRTVKLLPTMVAYLETLTAPPATTRSGAALSPAPAFQAHNIYLGPLERAGVPVTVSIAGPPFGATLSGTTVAYTDATGRARFTDLAFAGPPGAYTLEFRTPDTWIVSSHHVTIVP